MLFYLIEAQAQTETVAVLNTRTQKILGEGGANPMYAPSGHLVFARGTTLMAAPFDLAHLETTGAPVAVLPGVRHPGLIAAADYGVSRTGTTLPVDGGKADALIKIEFDEDSARVSPDGRWLAYRSNRSGRSEIWVRATTGGAPVRVSQDGGREPVWSRSGRELFYLQGNKMIALAVKTGQDFSFAAPVELFDRPYFHGLGGTVTGLDDLTTYDVAADGQFLMIPESADANRAAAPATGIVVVQNWQEELKQRVATR